MPDINLCSHCYSWRCHPDDRFCGHCGENLLQAEVIIEPVSAIYHDSDVPNEINITIRNVRGGLGGTRFFWRNEAGIEVDIVNLGQNDLNQANQQESYQTKSIDLALDPAVQAKWSLIHWVADNKEYTRAVLSCGLTQPVLILENNEILLPDSLPSSFPYPISVTLKHKKGSSALLENINVTADEGAAMELPQFKSNLFPLELSEGKDFDFTLPITQQLWDVLKEKFQGFELTLTLQITDLPYSPQLPLKLRIPTPAKAVLKNLPETLYALEGRSLRLPIHVENEGGETCHLAATQVDIRKGSEVIHSFTLKPSHSYTLDAGKTYSNIINIPLVNDKNQKFAQGAYHCKVQQFVVEAQIDDPSSTTILKIKAVEKYKGIVTIDFGTTATAVAILPQGKNKSPISLELSSNKDKFIPTAIAYFLDDEGQLQYCIGHDAIALLDDTNISSDHLVYLDNLKWRLDDKEPVLLPDGSEKIWEDIAVDYLKKIKNLVEEYTDVVADVESVVITQPSRFHPLLIRALNSSYRKAGLMPLFVQLGDNSSHKSLAESWPSLTTCLPLGYLKDFQNNTVGYKVFGEDFIGKHAVLTYDVGGGSTDMSLFLVDIENFAKMKTTELGTDGTGLDDRFFGNGFSDLLFKSLWPSCENWLEKQGYDPKHFPITLPWQPLRADDKIGRENGRRCAEFVLEHLQGDGENRPFNNIHLNLQNIGIWDDKENEELSNLMTEFQEGFDNSLAETTLCLESLSGKKLEIPARTTQGTGIFLDFEAFIKAFIDTCSVPMFERLKGLVSHPDIINLDKIYLITTGRGAFFPLVRSMLWAHQERLKVESKNKNQKLEPVRVEHDYAKTIVSQGACYLAKPSNSNIVFVPRSLPSLGIEGGLDPDTGNTLFLPLCSGLPTPADGWQLAAYPLRSSGEQTVTVTLYLSADNKNFVTDNDTWLVEISQSVDIKSEQANLAHIMVKAEFDDCLEIYIGFPPNADIKEDDYELWDKYLLGRHELIPGACTENQKLLTQTAANEEDSFEQNGD